MRSKLLPFLLCLSTFAFAQDSVFQIKEYKYRTPGFRALFIQFNASGSVSAPATSTGNTATDKSFALLPSQFGYTRIISTEKRLHQSSLSFLPAYNYYSNDEGAKRSLRQLNLGLQWDRNDRFYKQNLWFFELGNRFTASATGFQQTDTGQRYRQSGRNLNNTLTLGFGKGRVERVQDAQMALFILNDLSQQGLLDQPVTKEKAYAFAQLITDINNRRVFDFRRRRIYELTMLDSFLRSSGLVKTTDIRHFTTVNDNWALSINPFRLSGSNWYLRVKPSLALSRYDSQNRIGQREEKVENRATSKELSPVVGYERYVPRSLKWQFNMGASLGYETTWQNYSFSSAANNARSNTWLLNAFYGIGFFPNNRTQFTGTLELTGSYLQEITYSSKYINVTPSLNLSAAYFLGYRTYLTAGLYANYQYNRYKVFSRWNSPSDRWSTSANVGFSHIIF